MLKLLHYFVFAVTLACSTFAAFPHSILTNPIQSYSDYDVVLYFPLDHYPETGDHIRDAIVAGHPDICTIDRDGADERRDESLAHYPPIDGYDRDEWPMEMCLESGTGADVRVRL
ncbi:hypothetical protein [Thermoactinomyces daqus]|uniref:hypothetical protein n=1 Tax=Thermoactinomyces daqus TaxID=1329516 RepID=UPI00068FBFD7|nr:hypothetical protein [Thermoactinomyces daqus]